MRPSLIPAARPRRARDDSTCQDAAPSCLIAPKPSADRINAAYARCRNLGVIVSGDLVLAPRIAARFAADLANAGARILGVGVWRRHEDGAAEELYDVDLSGLAEGSTSAARAFVARWREDNTHMISLITDSWST